MQSVIRLLPENLANQIAAGEVVQRPASVVKELLENSKDAGATHIQLLLREAGKQLIQVIDNGCGMSPSDARMCFERHATSKIKTLEDLFNIRTLGFRGEALASIAAVAQVELKTKLAEDAIGTLVEMAGGEFIKQEPIATSTGTIISVKNLFYNVPARRNFLKSNAVELRHIIAEFYHIALANSHIYFRLEHNGQLLYDLPSTSWKGRILAMYPGFQETELIEVKEETVLLKIHGWIGEPSTARKTRGEQYFFVNDRYIKSPYLHHAVISALGNILPAEHHPFYIIGLWLDPQKIDINIHPTKTEIKFENEKEIYVLLEAAIKRAIGSSYLSVPVYGAIEKQIHASSANLIDNELTLSQFLKKNKSSAEEQPKVTNPTSSSSTLSSSFPYKVPLGEVPLHRLKTVYAEDFFPTPPNSNSDSSTEQLSIFQETPALETEDSILFLPPRYILFIATTGIEIIDYSHALERILFEKLVLQQIENKVIVQQLLHPYRITCNGVDYLVIQELLPELQKIGFSLQPVSSEEGILVLGVPFELTQNEVEELFEQFIQKAKEGELKQLDCVQLMAYKIAARYSLPNYKKLTPAEMTEIRKNLEQCVDSNYSPSGKLIRYIISITDIEKKFK
ncbi:MAG: DNA mismatch repair endonuclease MutL [Bacteroidia bacterium]|nr:DNA mismatch repair endonuclease MutL [Bacteroidia bacterium]MDW8159710.1 DNA mismatch repair endonuclease MutL [Bacteroidia bacterium]